MASKDLKGDGLGLSVRLSQCSAAEKKIHYKTQYFQQIFDQKTYRTQFKSFVIHISKASRGLQSKL